MNREQEKYLDILRERHCWWEEKGLKGVSQRERREGLRTPALKRRWKC